MIKSYKNDFLDNFSNRLINRPTDRILIAICGESASGKSTICNKLKECINQLNLPITILTADNYFKDISDLISTHGNFDALRDAGYDVDSPNNFNLSQLREDICALQKGVDILSPEYLCNGTGVSKPKSIPVKSSKIIIAEGMCTLFDDIHDVFDVKVYVDLDDDIRRSRFLNRARQRNQDETNALKHWDYIKTAGQKYVVPQKRHCDIVINSECDLDYFAHMIEYINLITNNFSEE